MSSATNFKVTEHIFPCQYIREYPGATLENQEDTLQLHVKQYTPLDDFHARPGAVTIIAAHANGFPKVSAKRTAFFPEQKLTVLGTL